jgi:hypothetical protein
MKEWIMIQALGVLFFGGSWACAQQGTAATPTPNAQSNGFTVETVSGSDGGLIVVRPAGAAAAPAQPGLVPGPVIISGGGLSASDLQSGVFAATAIMAGKVEKTSFLGVSTIRASATLRSQLKLKAGLVVEMVEPRSSADAAGLQAHDVIEKLDDQWLINPAQFVGLIRMHKPGETVTLTILHQGERKKLSTKLEERESYVMDEDDDHNATYNSRSAFGPHKPDGPVSAVPSQSSGFMASGFGGSGFGGSGFGGSGFGGPVQRITTHALGAAPLSSGFIATFGDDKQELSIALNDGHQILTAKDSNGKQIFQGPIDTPEQRKLVPQDVRAKLEEMERFKFRVHTQSLSSPEQARPEK